MKYPSSVTYPVIWRCERKSPAGYVGASLNCGICNTADKVGNYFSRLYLSSGPTKMHSKLSKGKSRRLDRSLNIRNKVPVASI